MYLSLLTSLIVILFVGKKYVANVKTSIKLSQKTDTKNFFSSFFKSPKRIQYPTAD
jgi:hypothetical protein